VKASLPVKGGGGGEKEITLPGGHFGPKTKGLLGYKKECHYNPRKKHNQPHREKKKRVSNIGTQGKRAPPWFGAVKRSRNFTREKEHMQTTK